MSFIKNRTIHQSKTSHIYINECHAAGKKTRLFAIRKDGNKACGEYLGEIKFDGAWRQYVFQPDIGTRWSSGCLREIANFCDEMSSKWRLSLRRRID